jgi:hypothetical protein
MLKCRDIAEQGMPEGGLNLWQRWRFYLHLKMCKHCPRFYEHLRITRRIAAKVGITQTSEEDIERVVEQVHRRLDKK